MTTEKVVPSLPSAEFGRIISNRIFVGGFNASIGERELFRFFSKFGFVQHVGIVTSGGYTKGYGFVTFQSSDVVSRILKNPVKDNLILQGKKLFVGAAKQRSSQTANNPVSDEKGNVSGSSMVPSLEFSVEVEGVIRDKIFVSRLGACIGKSELFQFFSKFGFVHHVWCNLTKGYGFVTFHNTEVVNRILKSPVKDNLILQGTKLFVGAVKRNKRSFRTAKTPVSDEDVNPTGSSLVPSVENSAVMLQWKNTMDKQMTSFTNRLEQLSTKVQELQKENLQLKQEVNDMQSWNSLPEEKLTADIQGCTIGSSMPDNVVITKENMLELLTRCESELFIPMEINSEKNARRIANSP